MSNKIKKAINDLKLKPGRTLLVLTALILGVWGVGTILVSYVILKNDLETNFLRTKPAHLILESNDFERLNMKSFRTRAAVESAEFRDFSLHRIEIYPNQWVPLWLYGVEDFQNMRNAHIFYESGARVPPTGSMLMERNAMKISNLRVGTTPRARIGSKLIQIPVSGVSFDPAQPPATQDPFIYGFVDQATFARITGKKNNQRLVIRLNHVKSEAAVRSIAKALIADLNSAGVKITAVKVPVFNEHPHQWQLNTILLLVGSIGLLSFLMAAVLVSQLIKSIIGSQIRQIGMLKAIGATRFHIFQIYSIMLLLLGLGAGMAGVPLAVFSGYGFSYFVADILNFDILTTSLPLDLYAGLTLVSLLMPLFFSITTLLKGSKISAREALADYGISSDLNPGPVRQLPLPRTLVLGLRNSLRNKGRLAVTIIAMALGVAIFSTGFNVRQSLANLLETLDDSLRYDVQVVFTEKYSHEKALKPFLSLKNVKEIELWTGGRGELQSKMLATSTGVGVVALPYDTHMQKLELSQGRWLKNSEQLEIVLNQKALKKYGRPPLGGLIPISIAGKHVKGKLVGVVGELDRPKLYMDQTKYDALFNPSHKINSLMIEAKDQSYEKVIQLKQDVEKAIVGSDLSVLYVMSQAERVKVIFDHLNIILSTILILSLLVLIVSAIGMASATGINILERTREIGIMRAIGATPSKIYQIFISEGMLVSVISIILGMLIAWPLSLVASVFFGNLMLGEGAALKYAFSIPGFWITLIATLLFGWLASRIPAGRAVKISTREALSYE